MSKARAQSVAQLMVDGGTPARTVPFPGWPYFEPDEVEAVAAVLRSGKVNYWTGEEGREFEREYAAHLGRRHAVALANGTVALELALHVLGIGPGDEVLVPSRTFIASASCAVMRGAVPVCIDVDPVSQNLTVATMRPRLTPRTRAIVAVHLAGWPCEMDSIMAFAREHNLKVVEDCAQAHGATYKGKPVGSFGHVAAFSFCQDKIITTGGEGGLLALDEEEQWKAAWAYKDHGKGYDAAYCREHGPGFRWLHESFGTNWRLTEMQSALGRIQLRRLPEMVERRRQNAALLTAALRGMDGLRVPQPRAHIGHAFYKYYAFVRPEKLKPGWDRDRIVEAICAEGVPCYSGSCGEIYLEKAFSDAMRPAERFPVARQLAETSLMFLVHPTLGDEEMQATARAVAKVMEVAAR